MNRGGSVSLVLKPAGPPGEALAQALRAAGFCVRVAPTVFDVVTEAHRAGGSLQHLFVGVDHWGPNEFRLLPLVRREWPATTIVAYHSPGFAYKGRVAELAGADAVLGSLDEIVQFIESLAASAEPAAPVEPPPEPPPPAPVAKAETTRPVGAALPAAVAASPAIEPADTAPPGVAPALEPAPIRPPAPTRPPASPVQSIPMIQRQAQPPRPAPVPPASRAAPPQPQPEDSNVEDAAGDDGIDGEVIGTIELTDEELRLLLGENEEP
jgi:hypothetical protein